MTQSRKDKRQGVRYRIRKTISGSAETPRLAVFRSNKQIYVQLIDDQLEIQLYLHHQEKNRLR